jgi:hypothetical protein
MMLSYPNEEGLEGLEIGNFLKALMVLVFRLDIQNFPYKTFCVADAKKFKGR